MTSLVVDQGQVLFLAYKINLGRTSLFEAIVIQMQGPEHAFA
jgi:hypothetical protein